MTNSKCDLNPPFINIIKPNPASISLNMITANMEIVAYFFISSTLPIQPQQNLTSTPNHPFNLNLIININQI
jgi:hypothetical protein